MAFDPTKVKFGALVRTSEEFDILREQHKRKPLIVLDLDGTLILRRDKRVIHRKGLPDFLDYIFREYQVAVFTSITKPNLDNIIKQIFSNEYLNRLRFLWDRSFTEFDPNGINSWDTIKNISKIREYFPEVTKILMLDDSPTKTRFNSITEILIVPSFTDPYENYNLKELIPLIEKTIR